MLNYLQEKLINSKRRSMSSIISYQTALIYVMVVAAVADGELKKNEAKTIAELVNTLPVFHGYDHHKVNAATGDCASMLDQEDGVDAVIGLVKQALPKPLYETAYALACDVIAADGDADQAELQWLSLLQNELHISNLHAAAIERGSRARYMRKPEVVD